jgi:hypothetical protein
MKNAPTTDQSSKSAMYHNTLFATQNVAIKTLLQINGNKMPLPTLLNMLETQDYDRAEIRKRLYAIAAVCSIRFQIDPHETKPFRHFSIFFLVAQR